MFIPLARAATLFVLLIAATAAGAAASDVVPGPPDASSVLRVGGRNVATFRATLLGYTPSARAESARQRLLDAYAKNHRIALTTKRLPEGTQVLGDDSPMFLIANGDVNTFAGESTEWVARHAVEVLEQVIVERGERGDPVALAQGIGLALVASLVAFLLLRVVFAVDSRVGRWAARRVAKHVSQVKVANVALLDESFYLRVARRLVHGLSWAVAAMIAFLWLNAVLESLPFTRPWGDQLTGILLDALSTIGSATLDALPGLILVVLIIAIARVMASGLAALFDRVIAADLRIGWLDRDTARPTRLITLAIVWIFALAMAYPYLPGADSRALQGLSVLVGLMVSIGASGTIGQVTSGLILMFVRAFRVGDYVRIQEYEGTVTELGLVATRVRTGLGEELMLPNSMVLSNVSKNYSRAFPGTGFVIDTVVTIGYDTPWRQVHAMLAEAARRTPGIVADPQPHVFQTALSDFYVEYRLVGYSTAERAFSRAQAIDRLHSNIQDVFNENGVQIMSPHYLGDPTDAKIVPQGRWFEAPARREPAREAQGEPTR